MNLQDCPIKQLKSAVAKALIDNPKLYNACNEVLDDPRFQNGWASSSHHHVFKGSLPWHTLEVLSIALSMDTDWVQPALAQTVNLEILVTACIFHDYAKIWDYTEDGKDADYKKRINHIQGSFGLWKQICFMNRIPADVDDAVSHCLLSHHGRREWGSPVEPQTPEALTLHYADMMSAMFGKTKDIKSGRLGTTVVPRLTPELHNVPV